MSGLRSWNFWSPINGTLYGYRAWHPDDFLLQLQGAAIRPRVVYAYGGKTTRRDWRARAEEHMWGGGRYGSTQDAWADTVLGWRPDGTVEDVMAAGGYWNIWQGRTVPLLLSIGEVLIAIKMRRPYYNYQHNQRNRRRIPIPVQEEQRELRDAVRGPHSPVPARTRPGSRSRNQRRSLGHSLELSSPVAMGVMNTRRWVGHYRRWVMLLVLLGLGALFLPGMPALRAAQDLWVWTVTNQTQLIGATVLGGVALVAVKHKTTKRRRKRRRRWSRRGW